ncbi:MAG: enoyl-CoA hydratase-related protein [Armatimonadota bacterium]|nr:enoyl-CoA hydratase-related protein [Armatimonadota bacterium]MDR5689176.1 enoyl-CoA hydratase-related protein [Armatimonadota bacterium]MDR7387059.1 enoyl-CoA hydratase-related protein [Armatimonadota bacterium]MDR7388493.1 enoyl-CoA hydratase-related protein [Armatimonadota bacterium]MDR7392604.1 enoyl-CoA hydratase-related protein [Armatimonadota bacterium]
MNNQDEAIRVRREDGAWWVTLNRPPHNVLTTAVMRKLEGALREAFADPAARVVVLTAEGRSFCAGVDVAEHTAEKVHEMLEAFHTLCRTLVDADVPTVAAVGGAALGGGCELVALCDVVVASESATFGQPEVRVGVFPPVAAAAFLTLLGKQAVVPVLTGEVLTARQARELGLVTDVVAAEEMEQAVRRRVEQLSAHSAAVLRLAKRAALGSFRHAFHQALEEAERVYEELMRTEDAHEGLRAFLEKRKPTWQHR